MQKLKQKQYHLYIYIPLLVCVLIAMFGLKRCINNSSAEGVGITPSDTLRVAVIYGPMSYYLYDDTVGGFNHDMLAHLGHDLGIPVVEEPVVKLADALKRLEAGRIDMLASLPLDSDFKQNYEFTHSLFLDRQVLVQLPKDGRKVESVLDLEGKTIHVEKDSPVLSRLRNLQAEIGKQMQVEEHPDLSAEYIFMKVASGEFEYGVVSEQTARHLSERFPDVDWHTPVSFTQFQSWVLAKGDTVRLRRINAWIDSVTATPTYKSTLSRYQ